MTLALTMLVSTTGLVGCGNKSTATQGNSSNSNQSSKVEITPENENELWKQEEASKRVINIGYDGGICLGTAAIAHLKGFYEQEGLKTELVKSENARDAIGTGKLDTSGNFITAWAVPTVNGVNMKFVSGTNTGCQSLYVLANSPVNSTADLKGKKIVVPNGIGNSSHNITLRFLGHDNLDPKEFEFVHVETSAVILALQKGEIDGVTMSDQFAKKFVENGTLKVIRSITYDEDFKDEACCVYTMNGDFIEKNLLQQKNFLVPIKRLENGMKRIKKTLLDFY